MEIKQQVFAELDAATPGHAILASNTSSLSITEMGDVTLRPDKVVGFHFFYPASVMRLIEVIEGEETSEETMQAAANFAQQIRKMPIRCGEVPGFVVNRILNSAASEIWRYKDETGARRRRSTRRSPTRRVTPMGPFFLSDLLGLDTVLHVAEHLQRVIRRPLLRLARDARARRGGQLRAEDRQRFLRPREERELTMEQATAQQTSAVVERFTLKAFVEACLVLEEGVASLKDIETGMMTGAGILPGPVRARRRAGARRDARGARARRGRVGRALLAADDPAPARRAGAARQEDRARGSSPIRSRTRSSSRRRPCCSRRAAPVAIIWLNRPPANPMSPQLIKEFGELWKHCHESDEIRSVVIASTQHLHVLGRRRHQGVHEDGRVRRRGAARLGPRDAA